MNGSKGRARVLARIEREWRAMAREAGVDPADRRALRAFKNAETQKLLDRIHADIAARKLADG